MVLQGHLKNIGSLYLILVTIDPLNLCADFVLGKITEYMQKRDKIFEGMKC
jgi:hypothetical protein